MRHRSIGIALAGSLLIFVACDKKSDTPTDTTTTTSTLQTINYNKKPPGHGSRATTQHAVKGGTGATRPTASSPKMPEAWTDRQMRKPASVDMVDCTKLPDNSAECDGNNLYYCDDQKLWTVDCDAEAKFGGVATGSCFEGESFTNCLGCDAADDGSTACCDFQMNVCCDKDGNCYSPK